MPVEAIDPIAEETLLAAEASRLGIWHPILLDSSRVPDKLLSIKWAAKPRTGTMMVTPTWRMSITTGKMCWLEPVLSDLG